MKIAVRRKDYTKASKYNLQRINAAVTDIGWFLSLRLYLVGSRTDTSLSVNDVLSAQEFLQYFLQKETNKTWFQEIEKRAATLEPSLPSLRNALTELCDRFVASDIDACLRRRDLCIEVCLACENLTEMLCQEIERGEVVLWLL